MTTWPQRRFRDFLKPHQRPYTLGPDQDADLVGMRLYGFGPFHRERKMAMQIAKKTHFVIKTGDVLYNKLFAWKGTFGIVPPALDGMFVSDKFPTYELDRSQVDERFLGLYFRYSPLWDQAQSMSTGSAALSKLTLNPPKFLELTMPVPPLAEQRRIVGRIEAIAGRIEEAKRLRREAEEGRGALAYVFFRQVRQRLVRTLFQKARLGSVTRVTAGGTPSRDNAAYWGGDIPWIKTGELRDGDINDAEEKITQAAVDNSSAKLFPPDTVLIALYGQGQTRGRTGRLLISATTNQACCAVLPKPEVLDPRYVQFWLRSLYVELREKAQGGAQPNWNSGMIKDLEIAIPPLDKQREIVAVVDKMQAALNMTKRAQTGAGVELDAFLPAVLDKAFRGET